MFGRDAYPDLHVKAAALLHSLARNDALVDANMRLAWTACRTFLAIDGLWISAPEDERFDFVILVATGVVPDLDTIAEQPRARSYLGAEPLDPGGRLPRMPTSQQPLSARFSAALAHAIPKLLARQPHCLIPRGEQMVELPLPTEVVQPGRYRIVDKTSSAAARHRQV